MTLRKLGYILAVVFILGCGGLSIGIKCMVDEYNSGKDTIVSQEYGGRVYLQESEYQEFKEYLADNPDIEIRKLDILSSDNPLITFEVTTYHGKVFPWGELQLTNYEWNKFSLSFTIFNMCFCLLIFGFLLLALWAWIEDCWVKV